MRFKQFLLEGGSSSSTRYNTELASLLTFTNKRKNLLGFDPTSSGFKAEDWFDSTKIYNSEKVIGDINKFLPKNYSEKLFHTYYDHSIKFKKLITKNCKTTPQKFGWVAGLNVSTTPTDVEFIGADSDGISIKNSSTLALSNLSPKAIGISMERGVDAIRYYSSIDGDDSFHKWKLAVIKSALKVAKNIGEYTPNPKAKNYKIIYNGDDLYTMFYSGGEKTMTYRQLVSDDTIIKNEKYQAVFGTHLKMNSKEFTKLTHNVYESVGEHILPIIQNNLSENTQVSKILNMGTLPYFYQTHKDIYYVPSITEFGEEPLVLKKITANSKGKTSGVMLRLEIGTSKKSSEVATVDIWLRYTTRVFGSNSTISVQGLKNPQNLLWRKLN